MKSKSDYSPVTNALHVFTLSGFAIAQPLYDILSNNAEFFIARHTEPLELYMFTAGLSFVVPLVLLGGQFTALLLSRRLARFVHSLTIVLLSGVIFSHLLNATGLFLSVRTASALALGTGILVSWSYGRVGAVRTFFTVLSPSVLIFPVIFLMSPGVTKIVSPADTTDLANGRLMAGGGQAKPIPIVMVIFDEWPLTSILDNSGNINSERFPHIQELADSSTWYRNATTVTAVTNYAIPSILSGYFPSSKRRYPVLEDYPENLLAILESSHKSYVYESATRLARHGFFADSGALHNPAHRLASLALDSFVIYLHLVVPEEARGSLPPIAHQWGDFLGTRAGRSVPDSAEARKLRKTPNPGEIESNLRVDRFQLFDVLLRDFGKKEGNKPPLHFLHILFPHTPWVRYPSGRMYTEDRRDHITGLDSKDLLWEGNEWLSLQAYQRHLLQVGALDTLIGKLFARLKEAGLFDDSLVIVMADHGASFRPGEGYRQPTEGNYGDVMPIPLFIKYPHQKQGIVDDRNVEIIDVFPTIMDLLGLEAHTDGVSVLASPSDKVKEKRYYLFYSKWEDRYKIFPPGLPDFAERDQGTLSGLRDGTWDSVYRIGPFPELLGVSTQDLEIIESNARFTADQEGLFPFADEYPDFLPGLVSGTIMGGEIENARQPLALSLDGTVVATTWSYQDHAGRTVFSSLIPEDSFRNSAHDLGIFRIDPEGGRIRLSGSRERRKDRFFIKKTNDFQGEMIESSSGLQIPIVSDGILGFVESATREGRNFRFTGWVADIRKKKPPVSLLVFIDGELILQAHHTAIPRPDIEEVYGVSDTGYQIMVPAEQIDRKRNVIVRVFALWDDNIASEMKYHDWYVWREGNSLLKRAIRWLSKRLPE